MQRPKCRLCGALHYANEPHADFDKFSTKHSLGAFSGPTPKALRAARGASRLPEFVTREVPRSEPASRVKALEARIEELEDEVKQLKRLLAEANAKLANTANAPANTPANAANKPKTDRTAYQRELMRKRRAAKRRPFGEQQFEG